MDAQEYHEKKINDLAMATMNRVFGDGHVLLQGTNNHGKFIGEWKPEMGATAKSLDSTWTGDEIFSVIMLHFERSSQVYYKLWQQAARMRNLMVGRQLMTPGVPVMPAGSPAESLDYHLETTDSAVHVQLVGEGENWFNVTLEEPLDKAFVTAGPLTVHVSRTDEGVVADIWGDKDDDEPLGSTWAHFNEAGGER